MNEREPAYLLWLDFESSGLDPRSDRFCLLEVAAILTDYKLHELGRVDTPIARKVPAAHWPYNVRKMHRDSGLNDSPFPISVAKAANQLHYLIDKAPEGARVCLAGNSVGQADLQWLKAHMPAVAERLHYRVRDVTSISEMFLDFGMIERAPKSEHRAMADVERSILIYRTCLKRMFSQTFPALNPNLGQQS